MSRAIDPKSEPPVESARTVAPAGRPWGVWAISAVLGLEAAALLITAAVYVIGLFTVQVETFGGAVFLTVLLFLLGAALAAAAVQHFRGYRWTRAAAFVWQLLMLTIAVPTLTGGYLWGLALLLPPLLVLVLLFFPSVVAFTMRRNDSGAL
ncbi:hypothetical protein [Arthrobacter russicus]|uniref:Integral membrane protein n=1 Tax=Arthrobacter russicus TaxID=172040 RepID=A0ABU1J9L8_9MICC|nr:hypothetical protein [Arthrobacter russicus]MDR6268576.1 hypothetical protein [Arthrobacter russicus]